MSSKKRRQKQRYGRHISRAWAHSQCKNFFQEQDRAMLQLQIAIFLATVSSAACVHNSDLLVPTAMCVHYSQCVFVFLWRGMQHYLHLISPVVPNSYTHHSILRLINHISLTNNQNSLIFDRHCWIIIFYKQPLCHNALPYSIILAKYCYYIGFGIFSTYEQLRLTV